MKLPAVLLSIIVIIGLLISNILFLNKAEEAEKSEEFYKMKFETLQGDVDLLTYDLITSRDSVRILNNELESCRQSALTREE
jgi:hypothetical protein